MLLRGNVRRALVTALLFSSGCADVRTGLWTGLREGTLTIFLVTAALAIVGYVVVRTIASRRPPSA